MAVNIPGIVAIVVFYLLILAVGMWAGRRGKKDEGSTESENAMLAGRNIGTFTGLLTLTATWVGGGYINGTAEVIFNPTQGAVWCQGPIGSSLGLIIGGLFFAKKFRSQGYVTMLDPFQQRYGRRMGGLLVIPELLGDIFWGAGILAALGASLSVVLDMDLLVCVLISAAIAIFYTLFGGLYSVVYTDVIQLFCIFIGTWLCVPFAFTNPNVSSITSTQLTRFLYTPVNTPVNATLNITGNSTLNMSTSDIINITTFQVTNATGWFGVWDNRRVGIWIDYFLLLTLGGIPWQAYFQRVLAAKSTNNIRAISVSSGFLCMVMAIPSFLIGAIGASTDWQNTAYGRDPAVEGNSNLILPLILQYLTPTWVSFFGLGAVSAAVMSSADSCILAASSVFAKNVYKEVFRQKASETEIVWVMRFSIFAVGAMSTAMAVTVKTIYGLWYLCSDMVYVILFPQLICVIYLKFTNTYGSLGGFLLGMLLRFGGGEELLFLPAVIKYPFYDDSTGTQYFPFRSFAMLCSFVYIIVISLITKLIFEGGKVPLRFDVFYCFHEDPNEDRETEQKDVEVDLLENGSSVSRVVNKFKGGEKSEAEAML
ncbi:PREDICTED: high affinity choline transporter 1-like [Branchiostoma belcheri]|uniref:High affinity choline transporter 1-like n=1 Tax=Branchiostoma belcheri TaxID=7741 RepID=A0A6P5APQ4_BRABE|nr:PREDICTED: high affinity choline transporter 1-like [Branchiostoma belcheri]